MNSSGIIARIRGAVTNFCLLDRVRGGIGDDHRYGGGVVMDHQPATVSSEEEVCGRGLSGVKARIVEYGYILRACDPGEVAFDLYHYVGGIGAHFLPAFEYSHPALTNTRPAGDQVPSRMDTPDPALVRP